MRTNKRERQIIQEIICQNYLWGTSSPAWISANRKTRPAIEKALDTANEKGLIIYKRRGKTTRKGAVKFTAKFTKQLSGYLGPYRHNIGCLLWSDEHNKDVGEQLIHGILKGFNHEQQNAKNEQRNSSKTSRHT